MPPPQKPAAPGEPTRLRGGDELADEAQKLEEELEALKAKYEMYFLGVERREPVRWREDVKKKVLRLKSAFTRNTGLRFRIQSLHARYLSYERLWLRAAREREEGTYRRDLFKARLHTREVGAGEQAAAAPEATGPAAGALPARTPTPPPVASAPSAAPAADARLHALFDEYVAAKRRCNEDVSRLSYDALAKTVAKQIPALLEKYKARSVDFRVEVKDGKAVLKAIPKV